MVTPITLSAGVWSAEVSVAWTIVGLGVVTRDVAGGVCVTDVGEVCATAFVMFVDVHPEIKTPEISNTIQTTIISIFFMIIYFFKPKTYIFD
jgi:hypothetical protein